MGQKKNITKKKHHPGLWVLLCTMMSERAGHYGMKAIFVLCLTASLASGGYGWSEAEALTLYGLYCMLVYTMCVPGGFLADRYFSKKKLVMAGGFILCAGHISMAIPLEITMYLALTLIGIGVGLQKPNLTAMLGDFYDRDDPRQTAAHTMFYMGINIGAFVASIAVAFVGQHFGWHYGFGLAGLAMLASQICYIKGQPILAAIGNWSAADTDAENEAYDKNWKGLLFLTFSIGLVFWSCFEQGGGLMNLYAENYSLREVFGYEIPAGAIQSLNPFFVILLGLTIDKFWDKRTQKGNPKTGIFQMGIGTIILGVGFFWMALASCQVVISAGGEVLQRSGLSWLVIVYLFHTVGELCLGPVANAYINKLAPKKQRALMQGISFGVTGLGGFLASQVGIGAEIFGQTAIFAGISLTLMVIGLGVLLFPNALLRISNAILAGASMLIRWIKPAKKN